MGGVPAVSKTTSCLRVVPFQPSSGQLCPPAPLRFVLSLGDCLRLFFYVFVEALVCVIFQRPHARLSLSHQLSNTIHPPRVSHQPPQILSASAHFFPLNSINKLLTPSPHHTAAAEIKTCALCYLKPQHHFLLLHNRNDLYTCSHVPGTGAMGEVFQSSTAFLRVCGQSFPRRRSTGIPRFRFPGVRDVALDTDAHFPLGTRDDILSPAS